VGNQSAYKNVGLLLQAAEQLRRRIPHLSVFLTWPPHDRANRRPGVVCLGYLGDTELAEALSLADVFVMPSLQETVGLPLLEAMSAGTPIAAADRPYAREVCGNAAAFFDPLKASDLANSMELVLSDVELRERLIAEGRRISEARRLGKPYEHLVDELAQVAEGVRQKASPR
jgi:glycosyltransferase involved in cell wall biosynthesis